jgi:WS/DGAT/MGAT family acyltransferase
VQQLSSLDSAFLSLETPEIPGHIGGLAILDPTTHPDLAFDAGHFTEFVAERLALCPRFSWKLQEVPFGLDEPYWVEDEELDLSRHIQTVGVPTPGGLGELTELAGYLFSRPLDRSQPLWEMFYIEGLQGGRVALLWKVHHCLMDGVSGAGLVEMLFDMEPVPSDRPLIQVQDDARAGAPVGLFDMATRAIGNAAKRPISLVKHLSVAGNQVYEAVREEGLAGLTTAPHSSLNGVVGSRRSIGAARISLERVRALKNELDVTINDVVLSITGDAVRRYLESRGQLPDESLVAAVPVSTRDVGDKSMGNQVSEMNVIWGTHIEDPLERIQVVNKASMEAKRAAKAGGRVNPLEALSESLLPGAMQLFSRLSQNSAESMPLPANAVVSNVPMSPIPIYIAGAKIDGMVPMSMLAPTHGINITVLSYCGEMHFGLLADPDMVEGVSEIADAIPKALLELEAALSGSVRTRS